MYIHNEIGMIINLLWEKMYRYPLASYQFHDNNIILSQYMYIPPGINCLLSMEYTGAFF